MTEQHHNELCLAILMQGLLSTGHYTDEEYIRTHPFKTRDRGEDWREQGYSSRYTQCIVTDAIRLLDTVHEEVGRRMVEQHLHAC